jgi:hypothetical protein
MLHRRIPDWVTIIHYDGVVPTLLLDSGDGVALRNAALAVDKILTRENLEIKAAPPQPLVVQAFQILPIGKVVDERLPAWMGNLFQRYLQNRSKTGRKAIAF